MYILVTVGLADEAFVILPAVVDRFPLWVGKEGHDPKVIIFMILPLDNKILRRIIK